MRSWGSKGYFENVHSSMEHAGKFAEICQGLEDIIQRIGEPLEGNCVYRHLSLEPLPHLHSKRLNYQRLAKGKQRICEIGFNAGHSLVTMLLVNPSAHYIVFDLGEHRYARPCFDYVQSVFPQTMTEMIWGDSRLTLPLYAQRHPDLTFNIIHIDGGHTFEVYVQDWANALRMVSKDGLIIFDDTNDPTIGRFVEQQIQAGVAQEVTEHLETFEYQHRILRKI